MNNTHILKKLFACFFLCLIFPLHIIAKTSENKTSKECSELFDKGLKDLNNGNYSGALENFIKAEFIAERKGFLNDSFYAKFNIARIYSDVTNFGDALQYYTEALNIANKQSEAYYKEYTFTIINNIALLYSYEKDYDMALEYCIPAYLSAMKKDSKYAVLLAINISDVYNRLGNYKEARKYLLETKKFPKSDQFELAWKINYAETLLLEGRLDEAKNIMDELFMMTNDKKEKTCFVCVAALLSRLYTRLDNPERAISFAKMALENTTELHERMELYDKLSTLYLRKKDFTLAFKYKDSLIMMNDSISSSIKRNLFEMNKVKLKIQGYKSETKFNIEKRKSERKLFFVSLFLSLIIFYFIYKYLKTMILKNKRENVIYENQQKILDMELESLKISAAEKNRKISAKALYFSGRDKLIEEVIKSLNKIPEINGNDEISHHITTLRNHLDADSEWQDFINYFEEANPGFLKVLQKDYPQLNPTDLRFISYMHMKLGLKEISTIFNITLEASKKRKQRIAKKMGIDVETLHEYILKLAYYQD